MHPAGETGDSKRVSDRDTLEGDAGPGMGLPIDLLAGPGGVPFAVTDKLGTIRICSEPLAGLLGLEASAVLGSSLQEFFFVLDQAAFAAGGEARLRTHNGAEAWARVRWLEMSSEYRLAWLEECTELYRARRALERRDQHFRQVVEQIPDGFFLLGASLREVLFASDGVVRLVGEEALAPNLDQSNLALVHPEDQSRLLDVAGRLGEEPVELSLRLLHPDGEFRCWVRVRTFPIRDEDGSLAAIGGMAEDITARRHVAETLAQARQHAARLVQAVQDPSGLLARGLDGAKPGSALGARDGLTEEAPGAPTFGVRVARLTPREREVMELLVAGASTRGIAAELALSPKTIEVYRARVMKKMEVTSVATLVRLALLAERPDTGVAS